MTETNMTIYDELVARGLIAQVTNEDEIKETILALHKDKAEVGIAASSAVEGGKVRVNINIKSAVDSKYRVAVWVLEDNIHSPQSGANASWQNMHSNCLRYMYGNEKTEPSVRYLTGFTAPDDVAVIVEEDKTTLIVNELEYGRAIAQSRDCIVQCPTTILGKRGLLVDCIGEYALKNGCKEIFCTASFTSRYIM